MSLVASTVTADQWLLPTTSTYLSMDRAWRLTVTPRAVTDPLAYFQDKVDERQIAGRVPGDLQKRARGLMEHLEDGQWREVWDAPLLNEVSPVEVVVSSSGEAVTFDNWHNQGYGADVVVIYDARGRVVRALGLPDFLPEKYIRALPRSVSSIMWGSQHYITANGKRLVLRVVVPSIEDRNENTKHIEMAFELSSGRAIPPDGKAWADALAAAAEVSAASERSAAQFIASLTAPLSDAEKDWHLYLVEAFFRLDSDWEEGYPATEVLRLPKQEDYQASVDWLSQALRDDFASNVIMIASPSQENLTRVLSEVTANVPPGSLKKARIYVVVDDAHTSLVAHALARTGATYIQLDPKKPIPQRKARLEAHLSGAR